MGAKKKKGAAPSAASDRLGEEQRTQSTPAKASDQPTPAARPHAPRRERGFF